MNELQHTQERSPTIKIKEKKQNRTKPKNKSKPNTFVYVILGMELRPCTC